MRAYGRRRKDFGCCPGHDKFPTEKYRSRRSTRAHRKRSAQMHQRARREVIKIISDQMLECA